MQAYLHASAHKYIHLFTHIIMYISVGTSIVFVHLTVHVPKTEHFNKRKQ